MFFRFAIFWFIVSMEISTALQLNTSLKHLTLNLSSPCNLSIKSARIVLYVVNGPEN